MPNFSQYKNLKLPLSVEKYNIEDFNNNAQIIDEELHNLEVKNQEQDESLNVHVNDKDNPHDVTKSQVGLSEVDNTSDKNKPISNKQQEALDNKVDKEPGKMLSTNDYTTVEKNKLYGIEENANKYTHPEVHPASIISQDGYNRFVTDEEKNRWNSALQDAKDYTDLFYQQSTGYIDKKIADLINGASSTMDTLGEIEKAITENHDVVDALHEAVGKKANQSEMDSLLATKLGNADDSKNNTITFTSGDSINPTGWTDIAAITSGLTHSTLANRLTTAVKNLRYIWKLIGSTDISTIGDSTVTGAINALNIQLGGLSLRIMSENDYTILEDKDPMTLYFRYKEQ